MLVDPLLGPLSTQRSSADPPLLLLLLPPFSLSCKIVLDQCSPLQSNLDQLWPIVTKFEQHWFYLKTKIFNSNIDPWYRWPLSCVKNIFWFSPFVDPLEGQPLAAGRCCRGRCWRRCSQWPRSPPGKPLEQPNGDNRFDKKRGRVKAKAWLVKWFSCREEL